MSAHGNGSSSPTTTMGPHTVNLVIAINVKPMKDSLEAIAKAIRQRILTSAGEFK